LSFECEPKDEERIEGQMRAMIAEEEPGCDGQAADLPQEEEEEEEEGKYAGKDPCRCYLICAVSALPGEQYRSSFLIGYAFLGYDVIFRALRNMGKGTAVR
jgi:hypothetical protein